MPKVAPRYLLPDALMVVASLYLSLLVRVSAAELPEHLLTLTRNVPIFVAIKLVVFASTGMYDILWRYVSASDTLKIFRSIFFAMVALIATTYLLDLGHIPRSLYFIDALLNLLLLGGVRIARRLFNEQTSRRELKRNGRRTLIYGAGANGRTLATRFATDSHLGLQVLGFIDDDREKIGMNVAGVRVLGGLKDLASLLRAYSIEEVVIAMTNAPGETLSEILQILRPFRIRPRLMSQMQSSAGGVNLLRQVELGDLLRRESRVMDNSALKALVQGRRVLVTGAGGSIGSEISRQVLALEPSKLLLLDHSEYNLYQIDHELRDSASEAHQVVPLLADLKDREVLRAAFQLHSPEIVFHAAAYKHVHLVELNPCSAILNNISGLKNLLELCETSPSGGGVESFVLISSDKAVNPVGVMGATKRVCELLVTEAGRRTGRPYCSVRFGNVLGSSGSLIPLLTKQIQAGQPVTVTHPDMTRYFMLIPEAVSLVLRAATIARPGDITLLKMGEPVKILDVARSLIAILGKTEDEVPIVFTGLRPGEKMFEELYLCGNEIQTTDPDVLIVPSGDAAADASEFVPQIDQLVVLSKEGKPDNAVLLLNRIVRGEAVASAEPLSVAAEAEEDDSPTPTTPTTPKTGKSSGVRYH